MPEIGNEAKLIIMLAKERRDSIFDHEVKDGRNYLLKHPDEAGKLKQEMYEAGLARGLEMYERSLRTIMIELGGD